jgi:quercetin dioxygenase-like cupin family protein
MKLQPTTFGMAVVAAVGPARSGGASSKLTAQRIHGARSAARHSEGPVRAMHHLSYLDWCPAPAIFPPGAMYAVVQGNPSVAGEMFTIRLRFPNGYILPPHKHPTDAHLTVLRGTFSVGLGGVFSADSLTLLQAGDFIIAPKNMAHFASARGATEVQVHAIGPFQLRYVNPADDPTKK